jgi:hypothetical protein
METKLSRAFAIPLGIAFVVTAVAVGFYGIALITGSGNVSWIKKS